MEGVDWWKALHPCLSNARSTQRRGFVVLLVKSGDPVIACSYIGIALQSCVAKVRARILTARLGEYVEESILIEAQGRIQGKAEVCQPDCDLD